MYERKIVCRKSSTKCEYHDVNVFLKVNRTLSKLNFLFYLKSKTNLVTLRKCNSLLQYYKIDLSFSIKLQEINLNVCEEYKTEREVQQSNRVPLARSNLRAKCAITMCPRSRQVSSCSFNGSK